MQNENSFLPILSKPRIITLQCLYWIVFLQIFPRILPRLLYTNGVSIDELSLVFQCVDYGVCMVIAILIALPILKKERHFNIGKLVQTLILSIGVMFLMNIVFAMFTTMLDLPQSSNNETGLNEIMYINRYYYLAMVVVFAPILEELVFRGGIFRVVRTHYNFLISALISALLFGFIHISSSLFSGDFMDVVYLILYSGLGFVLCYAYERNGSIYASIAVHMLYNLVGSSFLLF